LLPVAVKTLAGGTHKAPLKPEPVDQCRLCQELAHAGHFVAPSVLADFASLSLVAAIFATLPSEPSQFARAFGWNSRAPRVGAPQFGARRGFFVGLSKTL
jgi:hypothetical protein